MTRVTRRTPRERKSGTGSSKYRAAEVKDASDEGKGARALIIRSKNSARLLKEETKQN